MKKKMLLNEENFDMKYYSEHRKDILEQRRKINEDLDPLLLNYFNIF